MRSQNRSSQDNSNIIQKIFPISLNSATTAAPHHLTLHNLTVSLSYFRRAYKKMQLGAGAGHMHRFLPAVHCSLCLCCSGSLGHQTPCSICSISASLLQTFSPRYAVLHTHPACSKVGEPFYNYLYTSHVADC